MEYPSDKFFPTSGLDDADRRAEIEYLRRFLMNLLNSPDGTVNCAECGQATRVLVITTESSYVCVPCSVSMDIVEHRQADGCYQIGD